MSDSVLLEFARQVPSAALLFVTILVFLNFLGKSEDKRMAHESKLEEIRAANAKEREEERRKHELTISNMQANNMKQLVDSIAQTSKAIAEALDAHERASQERYEKMGITDDLLTAAREQLTRKR